MVPDGPDLGQPRPKAMTTAEQILFGNRFKRSEQVWKPNHPSKSGKLANFLNEGYKEVGPAPKPAREPLGVWT